LRIRGRIHRTAHALHNGYSQGTQNDGNAEWEQNPRPEASREAESKSEQPDKALEAAVGRFRIIGAKSADQRRECQANKQDGQKPGPIQDAQVNGHGQTNDQNPDSDAANWIFIWCSIGFFVVHDLSSFWFGRGASDYKAH